MSACATHIKRINPLTGDVVIIDVATGAIVADPGTLECCPERHIDKEKVCVQPTGNADPALIVPGFTVSVISVDAAGAATVDSTMLYDAAMATDLTASHEVVACPDMTPIDVPMCVPA